MRKAIILGVLFSMSAPLFSQAKIKLKRKVPQQAKQTAETKNQRATSEESSDLWEEKEKARIRERYFSQFQNVFMLSGGGISFRDIQNGSALRGFTETPDSGGKNGMQPGFGGGMFLLAEIKNKIVRANTFSKESPFLRLGSISDIQFTTESRRSIVSYGQMLYLRQNISIGQTIYYYFDPRFIRARKIPVLKNTTFFLGPTFLLESTMHYEMEEVDTGLSFAGPRETDFYLGGSIGWHMIFKTNWMILFKTDFLGNLSPDTSHPFSGKALTERYGMNIRLSLAAGVRL